MGEGLGADWPGRLPELVAVWTVLMETQQVPLVGRILFGAYVSLL